MQPNIQIVNATQANDNIKLLKMNTILLNLHTTKI